MGTVNVNLGEASKLNLILGQQLENAVTSVVFDFSAWQTAYGSGTLGLSVQRPGDEMPYAVTMTVAGTNATWSISSLDTAYKGVGEIQVTYTVGSVVKKSVVYKFTVYKSLGENGEYPSPGQTWQEEIEDEITDIKQDLNYIDNLIETEDPLTTATHETGRAFRSNGTIGASSINSIAYFPCEVGVEYAIICNQSFDIGLAFGLSYSYDASLIDMQLGNSDKLRATCPSSASGGFVICMYPTAQKNNIRFVQYLNTIDIINDELDNLTANLTTEINDRKIADLDITDTINDIVTAEINLLEDATIYEDYLYPHYSTEKTSNTATNCFSPIPVKAGTTYYFRRAWGNFSCIKYDDGNYISLSSDTTIVNGSVTPSSDGYAYITVESDRDAQSALFTTSQTMYTKEEFVSKYVPNKLVVPKTYTVKKDGSGDFAKLSDAIIEATKYMDSVVYVGKGTWDIIDELGTTYIESVGINKRGLYLKNRVHLIFASDSKVTCNYTGTTASVRTWLSAFNAGEYGFTLENCRLEASNCRYAVHDERDTDTEAYTNRYINCSMKMDNSTNTETTAHQCIGGGLGLNGHIIIENCDFESINTRAVPSSAYTPVSYHNSAGTGKSRIDISGVYMVSGTVRLNKYGSSTENTECYVHDCSFTYPIINDHEAGSTAENMNVTSWNNEIRN